MSLYSLSTTRLLAVLYLLAHGGMESSSLTQLTGIPKPSMARYRRTLRDVYQVQLEFIPIKKGQGRKGYYRVVSWGMLSKSGILMNFPVYIEKADPDYYATLKEKLAGGVPTVDSSLPQQTSL